MGSRHQQWTGQRPVPSCIPLPGGRQRHAMHGTCPCVCLPAPPEHACTHTGSPGFPPSRGASLHAHKCANVNSHLLSCLEVRQPGEGWLGKVPPAGRPARGPDLPHPPPDGLTAQMMLQGFALFSISQQSLAEKSGPWGECALASPSTRTRSSGQGCWWSPPPRSLHGRLSTM